MNTESAGERSLVISYLTLRKLIGILGISLPFILYLGAEAIFGRSLRPSVSAYYFTGMRDVMVGVLCVIGFFLLSYRGYDKWDNILGDLGCLFALGVAFVPTTPQWKVEASGLDACGYIHAIFTGLFFGILILFCLWLFVRTKEEGEPTRQKLARNRIYRICGYLMIFCILAIGVHRHFGEAFVQQWDAISATFWFEAIAVAAFGFSWLTKGETILKDK